MSLGEGYFEIGIYRGKTPENVGTLWRSAYQLGAAGIFTIGHRYVYQASDTVHTYRHIPLRQYDGIDQWKAVLPYDCPVVGVEMSGGSIIDFKHFHRSIYLLGAEDNGLSREALSYCHYVISLPSVRSQSYNVAVAGSIVMYDRFVKRYKGVVE